MAKKKRSGTVLVGRDAWIARLRAGETVSFRSWAGARWVVYQAHRLGFPLHGESAGFTQKKSTIDGATGSYITKETLQSVVRQARDCRMDVLMWAFSFRFYDPVAEQPFWPKLADYQEAIKATKQG